MSADEFGGIPLIERDEVTPGTVYRIGGGLYGGPLTIVMHPLDVIAARYPNPYERLGHAMDWIVGRAHRQLDALATRLEADRG